MSDLWFHRVPADLISSLFALLLLLALFASRAIGRRRAGKEHPEGLGSLEAMASGLLGLLLESRLRSGFACGLSPQHASAAGRGPRGARFAHACKAAQLDSSGHGCLG